jgi:hypothetical protein
MEEKVDVERVEEAEAMAEGESVLHREVLLFVS